MQIDEYFRLLSDEQAMGWLMEQAGKTELEARQIVAGYRRGARERKIEDSVSCHYEVQPGVTVKKHIPLLGPCVKDFQYLQDWDFPDPPTEYCLVSFIPRPLEKATTKNVDEQHAVLAELRRHLELPESDNHLTSFGSAVHISGIALAHYKATGKDIFAGFSVRTDTCGVNGSRLILKLKLDEGVLSCINWIYDVWRLDVVSIFALGVVKALGRSDD